MKPIFYFLGLITLGLVSAAIKNKGPVLPADVAAEYNKISGKLDYNQHIKPILSDKCFACHGPDKAKQKAGLRLDQSAAAYAPLPESPGKYAIRPGSLLNSEVFHRILSTDPEYRMPTPASHLSLSAKEKALLAKWIEQGAEYQLHWAFVKPQKKPLPVLSGDLNTDHPIDRFVRAGLQEINVKPAPQAAPELLLRRLYLDLTGLPPTLAEIDAFLADTRPNAYELQVDKLLASAHYGERMATEWLDLARFADSHGYTVDRLRDMSPYRDWVINAFNSNMPYDRFIQEQLAGDMMSNPTKDMVIATAFNRIHAQNMEGGIVEEEYQTEYVMDRTNTFGDAFMAMSLGCARCHDHKYDPISQKNYYELYSFFNNVLEAGQISWNDDIPTPSMLLPTAQQEQVIQHLQKTIGSQEQQAQQALLQATAQAADWIAQEGYRSLQVEKIPLHGLKGKYTLDGNLVNEVDTAQKGQMKHETGITGDKPVFVAGRGGQVLALDGDVYLDLEKVGIFRSADPFTIGIWVWIPAAMKEGVLFHKSEAERLYNFKGFHVYLKNNRLELLMAHTAPSNAIIQLSEKAVPRDQWVHLSMVYDGSSRAEGLQLYQNGEALAMQVIKDRLYKDIVFHRTQEPALQIGAWWRGVGFKGGKVDDILVYDRKLTPFEIGILSGRRSWSALAALSPAQLDAQQRNILSQYYASTLDPAVHTALQSLKQHRARLADTLRGVRQIMVMEEMPVPKTTRLLLRGQYDQPGPIVKPNTPIDILSFPASLPKNRLGLAQWLTHADHPLTSRVAVNRIWQHFFGQGLVKTSEDFGNQGALPSHPALLDWLAVAFRESGWNQKQLVKLVVTSATYKQDAYASPALRELDPDNKILARGPTNRLTAEMMRDNVLTASGLINKKIGGKSFRPYQPEGLWEINSASYTADSTNELYRRSLYIIAKRTVPNPTMSMFDASERASCMSRRQKTNTPLQALVMMNDPGFLEAAKVMGESMSLESDINKAITLAYRKLTGKSPSSKELSLLRSLQKVELDKFTAKPDRAIGWLSSGIYTIQHASDKAVVAANAVVASTIMNSDACITKR